MEQLSKINIQIASSISSNVLCAFELNYSEALHVFVVCDERKGLLEESYE